MDLPTLLLLTIAIIEGFVGILQLIQMVGTRVAVNYLRSFVAGFGDPEARVGLFKEIAHGVMRAASERAGAVKGAASREMGASLLETADLGTAATIGLAEFLPKKYRAFAPLIAPYIQQFMSKNMQQSLPSNSQSGQGLP